MSNTINLKIKSKYVQTYQEKYPLIEKEIIENIDDLKEEGTTVNIMSPKNKFIAKGYYGRQNKGYGWVLTYDKNEQIDKNFFVKKIKNAIKKREDFYAEAKKNITTAFSLQKTFISTGVSNVLLFFLSIGFVKSRALLSSFFTSI